MICLAFVLYNVEERFLDEFIESVNSQTYSNFDLFVLAESNANGLHKLKNLNKNIIDIKSELITSPVNNRNVLIQSLRKSKYDYVVFADIDDIMSPNRVESSLNALKKGYNVVYNDLIRFHNKEDIDFEPLWGSRLDRINLPNYEYNVLGLGNTAIRTSVLEGLNYRINSKVFDWSFFLNLSSIVELNVSLIDGYTYYRVHRNSLLNNLSDQEKLFQLNLEVLEDIVDGDDKKVELNRLNKLKKVNKLKYVDDGFWFEKV
ncbi:glycosyltransferase family 2 protein [Schleiferiaceae bacterium]|nr:glycosyltransferase family 2 protein [Schleiferiaceae bacterium]